MTPEIEATSSESDRTKQAQEMCESIMKGEGASFLRKNQFPILHEALQFLFGRLDVGMILIIQEKTRLGSRATAVEYTRLMNIKAFLEQVNRLGSVPEKIRELAKSSLQKCAGLLFKRHDVGLPPVVESAGATDDGEAMVQPIFDDRNTKPTAG